MLRQALEAADRTAEIFSANSLHLSGQDVLVVQADHVLTIDGARRIKAMIEEKLPGRTVLVHGRDIRLGAIHQD